MPCTLIFPGYLNAQTLRVRCVNVTVCSLFVLHLQWLKEKGRWWGEGKTFTCASRQKQIPAAITVS